MIKVGDQIIAKSYQRPLRGVIVCVSEDCKGDIVYTIKWLSGPLVDVSQPFGGHTKWSKRSLDPFIKMNMLSVLPRYLGIWEKKLDGRS